MIIATQDLRSSSQYFNMPPIFLAPNNVIVPIALFFHISAAPSSPPAKMESVLPGVSSGHPNWIAPVLPCFSLLKVYYRQTIPIKISREQQKQ
jgi:hypothetical protein